MAEGRNVARARNLQLALTRIVVLGAAPAVLVSLYCLWHIEETEVRWTLIVFVVGAWLVAASAARQMTTRALHLIGNLLGALREGDYSIRGLTSSGSSMSMVMREVNDLGSLLRRQRTEAVESTALLTHVMEEIGVAVFAFDPASHLLVVNKAGEQLLGKSRDELVGSPASA